MRYNFNELAYRSHQASVEAGWWPDDVRNNPLVFPAKLCLAHSELDEALEGFRKDKMDDHLPHRKAVEVELADAIIRIADLCEFLNLDVASAIEEKMAYNKERADHKPEARAATNGKKF